MRASDRPRGCRREILGLAEDRVEDPVEADRANYNFPIKTSVGKTLPSREKAALVGGIEVRPLKVLVDADSASL